MRMGGSSLGGTVQTETPFQEIVMMAQRATSMRSTAHAFAERWRERGSEKSDTHSFWLGLCRDVLGMDNVTEEVLFEQKTTERGYIDVLIPTAKTLVEQKSRGTDLDTSSDRQGMNVTPFEQAKRYADSLPNTRRPDRIIVCNFREFRIHDLNKERPAETYESFTLEELSDHLYMLGFFTDAQAEVRQREQEVSLEAGAQVGRLYGMLRGQYLDPDSEESQHALNVLCVRLVFCLFAEDAGLFPKDSFYNYLKGTPAAQARGLLKELFAYLNTRDDERDLYATDALKAFPYVNGGLFADPTEVPPFTDEILDSLLHEVSRGTDWSKISPTIFGGVFESTLNPETRHAGGMHYTSPKNIHRVIDPLFLDALRDELQAILDDHTMTARRRTNALNRFHEKLGSLNFLDPACGSGNFLTETYISLRRLENRVLAELNNGQAVYAFDVEADDTIKVTLDQFHGIEINDFAVSVASTAMWIARIQANIEAQEVVTHLISDLPLEDSARILHSNALNIDWGTVLDPAECDYIIGNPPFLGARNQSKTQKAEITAVYGGFRNAGNVDYVAGWYMKAARYIADHPIRCAFVSTNSICQGEQVANVWSPIYDLGVRIDFAHDTFRWENESSDQAAVYCVIVSFSKRGGPKRLFHYPTVRSEPTLEHPDQLNAYLKDAPDVFVWSRNKPLSDVPQIGIGNKPIDGGHYLFTAEEKAAFLVAEPQAEQYFHRWFGAKEFLQGHERWVLWLGDVPADTLRSMPESLKLAKAVKQFREGSKSAPTRRLAETPTRFHVENIPAGSSILIPQTSSERRRYIPIGFVRPGTMSSNAVRLFPNGTPYDFGILQSRAHNAWMRTTTGRLKGDYQYSAKVVYNNFIWPDPAPVLRDQISAVAEAVLEAREKYPSTTISEMYDPDTEFLVPELMAAHDKLDRLVEEAYGLEPGLDEKDLVAHLFELYADTARAAA